MHRQKGVKYLDAMVPLQNWEVQGEQAVPLYTDTAGGKWWINDSST